MRLGVRVSSYNRLALPNAHTFHPMTVTPRAPQQSWRDGDEAETAAFQPLTREQAQELRVKQPPLSPWRVVGTQAALGGVLALLALLITGRQEVAWSVLYGAASVVVPAALMARGVTSQLGNLSARSNAVRFMFWQFVKIGVAVAMLLLAPVLVQSLSWPALLVGLVLCLKCYWVALLWRGPKKN